MHITQHVHALKINFKVPLAGGKILDRFVYTYLICGERICLVDSGVAGSERLIFDYLERLGRKPEEISLLVLTHSHPDHMGAALAIKEKTNCIIAAHAAERTWIEHVDAQYRERPVPNFHAFVQGSVGVRRALADGDLIDIDGECSLQIIHTPGHSRGSISLWLKNDGALFCGDALPRPQDIPVYEDVRQLALSIKKLKKIPGIRILLSAWDEPRRGSYVYQAMDESLRYLERIHAAVIARYEHHPSPVSVDFCRTVLKEMSLPEALANPLMVKAFESHVHMGNSPELFRT